MNKSTEATNEMIETAVRLIESGSTNVWGLLTGAFPDATSDQKRSAIGQGRKQIRTQLTEQVR